MFAGDDYEPSSIGDLLKQVSRKSAAGKRALKGRRLAQKVLAETLGPLAEHLEVTSVKACCVVIAVDSAALVQELESFRKQELLEALRNAGMQVNAVRVQLGH
jgi:hypothetical protein